MVVQAQSTAEACQQKQYYNRKIGTVNLKPGNLVLSEGGFLEGKRGRLRIGGIERLGRCHGKLQLTYSPTK